MRSSSFLVITRSRVWPFRCVSTLICCCRPKVSSRSKNRDAAGSLGESRWKLKSPQMSRGLVVVTNSYKRQLNSLKNMFSVKPFLVDGGGL